MEKTRTVLAVDAGNTNIKAAFFEGDSIIASESFPGAGELGEWLQRFPAPEGAAACSVRPATNDALAGAVSDAFGIPLAFLGVDLPPDVPVECDEPDKVGADRLANVIAAYHRVRGAAIVVDFGTAIAFDVISPAGAFLGGAIAPGLGTALAALHEKTALLPRVAVAQPASAIGRNTADAMLAGVVHGAAGLVDRIIDNTRTELGLDFTVLFSGADSRLVAPLCRTRGEIVTTLTLEGVRLAWLLHHQPQA